MISNLLVFGAGGQLGRTLIETASRRRHNVTGLTHSEADINDHQAVACAIHRHRPTIIINAAAYTAVDRAETDAAQAFAINRDGARVLAETAAAEDIPIVHISTDYVFDGRSGVPYKETDPVHPLSVYGRSKEEGERAVRSSARKHLILRTAWVYSPFGVNFVRTMLRLRCERTELKIVDDQTGSPTSAADLASSILKIWAAAREADFDKWGTYHYVGANAVTWYDFAKLIFQLIGEYGLQVPTVQPIKTSEHPCSAPRPVYSALDTTKSECTFGIKPKPLQQSLRACLSRIVRQEYYAFMAADGRAPP